MKAHLDIQHSGTLGNEGRTTMTIDENSIAHLMSILTDLYSDREMAIIREYSTNAYDSHMAAGQTRPIEVTVPNPDSVMAEPLFIVKDWGTGMSVHTIEKEFSKYGWSSRRDSDDVVGQLGLGCKSALAYTSQFTMVSRHEGVKATVLITREESGAGALQIVDTCATDEPNGVEIRIPLITSRFRMLDKCETFFSYWDPGTVLLNGSPPTYCADKEGALVLDPDVILIPNLGTDYLVMGNVPYPVRLQDRLLSAPFKRGEAFGVMARVPIGTINFTPSREQLNYTKRTLDTLHEARSFVDAYLQKKAQDALDQCATPRDALKEWRQWDGLLGRNLLYYRGTSIPDWIDLQKVDNAFQFQIKVSTWRNERNSKRLTYHVAVDKVLGAAFIVTDCTAKAISAKAGEQIRKYYKANNIEGDYVMLFSQPVGSGFLDDVPRVKWADITSIKIDASTDPDAYIRTKRDPWMIVDSSGHANPRRDYPTDVVCWIRANEQVPLDKPAAALLVCQVGSMLSITKREESRFVKEHPEVPHYLDWRQPAIDKMIAEATEWDWHAMVQSINHSHRHISGHSLHSLAGKRILDPELRSLVEGYAKRSGGGTMNYQTWAAITHACEVLGVEPPKRVKVGIQAQLEVMKERYPMLFHDHHTHNPRVMTEYVNAVWIVRNQLHLIPIL